MSKKIKQMYSKIVDKIDTKKAGIVVGILFFISLLPVLYVGFHNYATGDDYWYGVNTYRGWVENGIIGALKGSIRTVADFYENWQGTWFTMFLFTLSPNHFWEDGYIITIFISLACLIGSIAYLAHYYLVKKLNFTKGATAIIVCLISYLGIQYIPRTTSGLYWFNGIMHYSIPFVLGILAVVHSHKFIENKRKRDYLILFISFTLLGGGSYLAPLVATLAVCLILICKIEIVELDLKNKKFILKYDYKNLWILIALIAEIIGLVISFMAPGNNVRGGEEFGADLKWAIQCIYYAIDRGIYLGEDYFLKNMANVVVYIMLAVLVWSQLWRSDRDKIKFKMPLLFVIYMNGIYWATYVPEIYSRSDVSGGVPNTYFHVFLLITFANMIYVHGWVQEQFIRRWKKKAINENRELQEVCGRSLGYGKKYKSYVGIPSLILCTVAFVVVTLTVSPKSTNDYCMDCITNGSLEKYVSVKEKQLEILRSEDTGDVIVPEMKAPYPLLNLLISETDAEWNINIAKYYGKNSVLAEIVE